MITKWSRFFLFGAARNIMSIWSSHGNVCTSMKDFSKLTEHQYDYYN